MNKTLLCNEVQWPVEASFAIHVLSILSLEDNMNFSFVVSLDFLALGRVEPAKAHGLHHFNFIRRFSFQVRLRHMNSLRNFGF